MARRTAEKAIPLTELLTLHQGAEKLRESSADSLWLARTTSGISQVQLAASLDVSQSYVSQVENGKRPPTARFIETLRSMTAEARSEGSTDGNTD